MMPAGCHETIVIGVAATVVLAEWFGQRLRDEAVTG